MLIPFVEIICVTTYIGRVAVQKITPCCLSNSILEVLTDERPIHDSHRGLEAYNLIGDFCDVSRREPLRLMSERHIEIATPVETNYAIKAGAVQKQEVQRIAL